MRAHFEQAPFGFVLVCVWTGGAGERERGVVDAMCSEMSLSTSVMLEWSSVCSCLRQMTCSAPQGPPVILRPLSPTDPTDGPHRVCTFFVCMCVCVTVGVCVLKKCIQQELMTASFPCLCACPCRHMIKF